MNPPHKRYYPLFWFLIAVSRLPFSALYVLSDFLYLVAYRLLGYRKKVVLANLRNAFPEEPEAEIKALASGFYQNLCDVIVEMVKLASISGEELKRRTKLELPAEMQTWVLAGKPVMVLGSHQANWEWALPAAALVFPFPVDGVYKPLNNEFFEWFMLRNRSRLGPHLVKMKDTLRDLIRRQHIPRAISLLSDQTPPRGEIQYWTRFLNQDTAFYVGADKLAAGFKYPVYFLESRRLQRGFYEYKLELLADGTAPVVKEEYPITEAYARALERCIKANPADYLWSHKRWKHKKPVAETSK